ncbi:MAG: hypothetical protein KAQ78_09570, partial [Candidatus Latescibacteria bacterium]|nr:hypothetical protein [Candidatus Latescibacterota bacterium]
TYAPHAEFSGTDTFTYTVDDGKGNTDTAEVTVTVQMVNDSPVVSDILDRTILEGEMFSSFSLDSYVSDSDDSDAELTWSTSGNTELTVNISASRVASIGIPDVNWHGWETITFTASDSTGLSDGDAVKFIVEPVNDAPAARDVHLSPSSPVPSDTLVVGYSFTDVDGDSESGTELRWFKDGSLQSDYNDSRSVLPVATAKGESWHSVVRPKDGTAFGGAVHSDTVLIGNTAPRFLGPWEEEVELWETLRFVVRASDADGDELECVVDASSLPAGATFSAATWTFSWRPGEGQEAEEDPYEVRFRISDGSSGSVTGVVEIYVYVPLGLRMVRAPSAIGVTDYEAVVWWETNMASDSWVSYGLDAGYGQSAGSSVGVTDHRVPLLDLEPDTTYYYRAYSASTPDTVWGTGTFHTQADTSSPSVLTGPDVVGVTDSEATVLWETNEKSDTWVSYGYDGGLGLESGRLEWVRTHRVRLTDLASDTTITLRVRSADRAGNVGLSGVVTFLTHPAPDTTGPRMILAPVVVSRTDEAATVAWSTDEVSDSWVDYGLDGGYGLREGLDADVTDHRVRLTGLDADTTYHYRVSSRDPSGNPMASGDLTFRTKAAPDISAPHILTGPVSVSRDHDTAVIEWTTNELSDSWVEYGETLAYGGWVGSEADVRVHTVVLTKLLPGTEYAYRVSSTDPNGNGPEYGTGSFTTDLAPDTTAPVILTGPSVVGRMHDSATIVWATDEVSDSWVDYGETEGFGARQGAGRDIRVHTVVMTNLSAGTKYFYRVGSTDPRGNGPVHAMGYFTTKLEPDEDPPVILSGPMVYWTDRIATVAWGTDERCTGVVYYGTVGTYGTLEEEMAWGAGYAEKHSITLTGLAAGVRYYYRVRSVDLEGNAVVSGAPFGSGKRARMAKILQPPGWGGDFTTNSYADTQVPVILSGPGVTFKNDSRVTIGWETDERSDSVVEYAIDQGGAGKIVVGET